MNLFNRFLSICMLGVILLSTTGMSVYKHYCGDLLEAVSVYVQANPCEEDGCAMATDMGCCEDEHEVIQLEYQLHKVEKPDYQFELPVFSLISAPENHSLLQLPQEDCPTATAHSPPDFKVQNVPAYIRHQQLVYYG